MTLQFDVWPWKTIGHLFYATSSIVHHFISIGEFKLELRVRKRLIWVKIDDLLSRVTLQFDVWPWKTIGHLFYATSSVMHHFVGIGIFKLELQSGNAQSGSNSTICFSRVTLREIWRTTLKNNRAPLLSNIKLCASFHRHVWTQTEVTARKRISWALTSVTLTFALWPWPFAWTLLLSLVITPENFMMIRWWEHSEKGVTDGQTDGQTDRQTDRQTENTICRAAWSQLKTKAFGEGQRLSAHTTGIEQSVTGPTGWKLYQLASFHYLPHGQAYVG